MVVQVLSRIVYAMYLINIILQATIYNNNVQLKRNSFAFVGKRIRTQRLIPLDAIRSRAANQRRILLERKSLNRPDTFERDEKGSKVSRVAYFDRQLKSVKRAKIFVVSKGGCHI